MTTAAHTERGLQRWHRIGLGVRLAYNPGKPDVVRLWIGLGLQLARQPGVDEAALLQRMLRLLLHVGRDEGLPWFWRSVCVELTARPLARLQTLLAPRQPEQALRLHDEVIATRQLLDRVPPRTAADRR